MGCKKRVSANGRDLALAVADELAGDRAKTSCADERITFVGADPLLYSDLLLIADFSRP
jgi:hypothetical protein